MVAIGLVALLLLGQNPVDSGYISVSSNVPGIAVYLEGDFLGRTPIDRQAFAPGSYLLTIVSNDSLENVYSRIRTGSMSQKLSSVWTLTAIDAGTHQVEIGPGALTEVFIDYGAVLAAPTRAKWLAGCGIGSLFGLGALVGFLVGLLAF